MVNAGHKNLEKRKKFSKDYQPANKGRKKSIIKQLIETHKCLEERPLSREDAELLIARLITMSKAELSELANNETTPVFLVSIASAISTGIRKGDMNAIERLLDRIIGKPIERKEISGVDGMPIFTKIEVVGVRPANQEG